MQAAGDPFPGWATAIGRDFYVRQLHDMKLSFSIQPLNPELLGSFAAICRWALARRHARTGDPVAISSNLGNDKTFDRAIARGALSYADRAALDHAALDHAALTAAVNDGRNVAETG